MENLTEFFQRFRQLNVRSNEQLDRLVDDAQRIVRGIQPQQLRNDARLRQQVATELHRVQSVLDGLLLDSRDGTFSDAKNERLPQMHLAIAPAGSIRCIYGEAIDQSCWGGRHCPCIPCRA